ncbi:hypothetical protein RY831_22425 [Noviherbaspirillum sp. CPCC 100848]|uniref:Glycine-rich domain-containing protein-like n=1 Tax=Noviherbaspirillum album TaxID=3080276 RepID=A0ABU6JE51_9BURK|nr:hypothetical protein [Noviherbaspirillum sp. CPCC 100848]MEC4721929.1 hypothetical protein [Noviherbaspirillum sp. CPCC 100848]
MHQQAASGSKHKTAGQMTEAVFALDLDPIKFKLMDTKEGHGWTREEADRHELEYRRFLALVAKYPEEAITPDSNVDKFWHGHILDTMKYAQDCEQVFGYFLHHFPYFGMRGDEDAANLAQAAAKTRSLYQQEFGHLDAGIDAGEGSYCARAVLRENATDAVPEGSVAYCARIATPRASDASYCARVAQPAAGASDSAYCARVAAPQASYCARAVMPDTAYCARAAAPAMSEVSYCARASAPAGTGADAYCAAAKPAAEPAYLAKVLGKGRPTLDSAVNS